MIKIDFHIHTLASECEPPFDFDLEKLTKYISVLKLDCIAITNHNLFDRRNYEMIKNNCDISVFPGIEVNLEDSHMLVISSIELLDDFVEECDQLKALLVSKKSATYEDFLAIFKNYENYLLIPHYKKDPQISSGLLERFNKNIFLGEVSSAKKWFSTIKKESELIPVLFSDIRISQNLSVFPSNATFINCEDLTLESLKIAMKNRSNFSITEERAENEFSILPDGTLGSTGLNIIIGKRSSGKTHLLKTIKSTFKDQSIKHIDQFSIVKMAEEREFKSLINSQNNVFTNAYLKEIREMIEIVNTIDTQTNAKIITNYLSSLKEHAVKIESQDIYSKCKLFNETSICFEDVAELESLLKSLGVIIVNKRFKTLIEKHIERDSLIALFQEILLITRDTELINEVIKESNKLISDVRNSLSINSALTPIDEFDILRIAEDFYSIEIFNEYCNKAKMEKLIYENDLLRFKVRAKRKPYTSASQLKGKIGNPQVSLVEAFSKYDNPYNYIKDLFTANLSIDQICKSIFDIDYTTVNSFGNEISGGERAEYVLFSELNDASKFELVLIDEPESSFDNLFLRDNIRSLIKNLSNKTTVFLVTHNHTLGILLYPERIIYTEEINGEHNVYTGLLSSKNLRTFNGRGISNFMTLIDTMEAGEIAYKERGEVYENLKS